MTTTPAPAPQSERIDPTTGEVLSEPPAPHVPFAVISSASSTLGHFAAALAAAQLEIQNASKDRTAKVESDKASYSYGYATLGAVYDACRVPLAKNGIAVVQRATTGRENQIAVETLLIHKSGEWMSNRLVMAAMGNAPQKLGSAITYARRYALSALVGVAADEDDDGQAAAQQAQQSKRAAAQPKSEQKSSEPKPAPTPLTDNDVNGLLAEIAQLKSPDAAAGLKKKLGALKPRMAEHVQKQLGDQLRTKVAELANAALAGAPATPAANGQGAAQP